MEDFFDGSIVIDTVGGDSKINFGGAHFISRKGISKTFIGSGGGHTQAVGFSFHSTSSTNTVDNNVIEQPISEEN